MAATTLSADEAHVAWILGHTSPAITLGIYSHAFEARAHDERAREGMEPAAAAMGPD